MFKSLLSLGVSTLIKAGSSILVFVYAAHQWDAFSFGKFMYMMSVVSIVTLIAEFGFGHQILREVNQKNFLERVPEYLGCKIWLTVAAFLVAGLYLSFSNKVLFSDFPVFVALMLALTANSYSDMVAVSLRAMQQIKKDFYSSTASNLMVLIACFGILYEGGGAEALATVMLVGRVVQLILVAHFAFDVRRLVKNSFKYTNYASVLQTFKKGGAFAVDATTSAALINIDVLILARAVGFAETGVYQAAARFNQGIGLVFSVLIGFFLPKMVAEQSKADKLRVAKSLGFATFAVWGMVFLAFLTIALFYWRQPVSSILFHAAPFMISFGALASLRLFSGWLSILLTEQGRQSEKAVYYFLTLILIVVSGVILTSIYGAWGVVAAYAISYFFLTVALIIASRNFLKIGNLMTTVILLVLLFGVLVGISLYYLSNYR